MTNNRKLRTMEEFPGPNRAMDCPPEWNEPDEPDDPEPDPAQVAKDEAQCAAYEAACEYGYAPLHLASRHGIQLVTIIMSRINGATKGPCGALHPHSVY